MRPFSAETAGTGRKSANPATSRPISETNGNIFRGDIGFAFGECVRDGSRRPETGLDQTFPRIYVIRREGEQVKGGYLVGRRKAAPWEGYGEIEDDSDDAA